MVGKRISNYLNSFGIKQKYLSERSGLSISKISRICTGRSTSIDCVDYYKICKALNVPFETFIEE